MDKKSVSEALAKARNGEQRKFSQSIDLIINLKELNLKNPDDQIEFFALLHHGTGKPKKICALVGPELINDAKSTFDTALEQHDFEKIEKKAAKKLAAEHEFFVAQANIMPKVATAFGRILGPRGKMPNPKAGCVVPPKGALQPLKDRLQKTVKVSAKKSPVIMVKIGTESQPEAEIIDNIITLYDQIIHHLPKESHNIKNVLIKTTMGTPVKVA